MKKFMEKFNNTCANMYVSVKKRTNNEEGATTVEWVGLAFVILTLLAVVAGALEGNGDGLATAITGKISQIIGKVGGGE